MHSKYVSLSNFSQAVVTHAHCYRPDNHDHLRELIIKQSINGKPLLARGRGLSYSDCCVNNQGIVIDTSRLNHLLSFDETSGVIICEPGVSFAELFCIHNDFIPPVIPGTLNATLAGGVANDIHGKNNPTAGTLGHHIEWLELQTDKQLIYCSRQHNADVFKATIAGLGLTGIINRIALKLMKKSRFVCVTTKPYQEWQPLLDDMQHQSNNYDYQVAWLDLLTPKRALLRYATHVTQPSYFNQILNLPNFTIPKLPCRLLSKWTVTQFNRYYFAHSPRTQTLQSLIRFNNPLDSIRNWSHLYGRAGVVQFQSVFSTISALTIIKKIQDIIALTGAIPTLAVLKYFTQPGYGFLSFVEPGFSIAIDFIHNKQAKAAIQQMNTLITQYQGKIYLAKDLFLTDSQFNSQYQKIPQFTKIIGTLMPAMRSDLAHRLGLVK